MIKGDHLELVMTLYHTADSLMLWVFFVQFPRMVWKMMVIWNFQDQLLIQQKLMNPMGRNKALMVQVNAKYDSSQCKKYSNSI